MLEMICKVLDSDFGESVEYISDERSDETINSK